MLQSNRDKRKNTLPLVAHVIYALGTGGLENGLVNIINRFPPDRFRHAIVCITTADDFANRIAVSGVSIVELNKKPGHDFRIYWRLWRTLRELRPEILHTRNLPCLEMQAVGFLIPGLKKIHGEHGRDIYDLDGRKRRYQWLRRGLAPIISRFVCVSADLSDWLVEVVGIPAKKVKQIYNGVDPSRFSPRRGARPALAPAGFLNDNTTLVGTVGRLAEVKNQHSLVHAFSMLMSDEPSLRDRLRLALIGDGPLYNELQQLSERLGIKDLVWMPGDRRDVPELLRMLDIFALPSLAEGISNTVLEAMASGLPVVATRTGGTPELITDGENGLLVPVSDHKALASALRWMLDNPDATKAMGGAGRAIVLQKFNWDRTVEQYLSVYEEALGAGRRSR
jgi:sugar transferase (PEP-CTERM/EpsH1 system associated)